MVGDYQAWWLLNRDDLLIVLKEAAPSEFVRYERKTPSPDPVISLLSLVGYEGAYASIVKEIALRRLRKCDKVDEALVKVLRDPSALPPVKAWAAYALGDLKCKSARAALEEALRSVDPDVRGFSVVALGKLGAHESIASLTENRREEEDLRCLAILSLARAEDPKIRAVLAKLAAEKGGVGFTVRRAAILALGVAPSEKELALVKEQCKEVNAPVRAAAILALGLSGKEREIIRSHLAPKTERDTLVRACAALALGIFPDPQSVPGLIEAVEKETDETVRGAAAIALGRSGGQEAVESLAKLSRNKNYPVLSCYAALGLGLTHAGEALPVLVEGFSSKQVNILTASAVGVALLGRVEGGKPLTAALADKSHPVLREYAAVGLGKLGAPESLARLLECLKDPAFELRHAAAIGLALLGDPSACAPLEAALKDKQEAVRTTAALAFDLLTDDEKKALTLGAQFKADPRNQASRRVGPTEVTRLLNTYLPKDYKLPIVP